MTCHNLDSGDATSLPNSTGNLPPSVDPVDVTAKSPLLAHVARERRRLCRARQAGLTLVEIIVVLVILAILMAFLTGGLFAGGQNARARVNQLRMQKVKSALQQFQLQYNVLPRTLNELASCSEATGQGCIPVAQEEDLKDAWNNPFRYQASGNSFTLKTLGADGKDGGQGADFDTTLTGP